MARPRSLPRMLWRLALAAPLLLPASMPGPARAADPLPYTVVLPATGEAPLDAALRDSATLIRLRESAPVGPFALVTRARDDRERLKTALGSFGRYDGTVGIRIAGRDLDDPGLPDALDAATGPVEVAVSVTPGPLFTLRRLAVQGAMPAADRAIADAALGLKPGDPARAADVLAAGERMLGALRTAGHALAVVGKPDAALDAGARALDVAWRIDPGPRVDLGPITVEGLDRVNESYVRRRLLIHQGEPFDPAKIEAAWQDLAATGVFATVRAKAATGLDPAGQLPIAIDVIERPRHVVAANAGYSTDLGGTAGVTWQHRNLFGNAEQLNLGATITGLGGSAVRRPGYNVTAALVRPDVLRRDQTVTVSLQAIKESLDAYDRKAVLGGVTVARKLDTFWTASVGVQAQQSRIAQEGVTTDYTLLGVPLGLRYDSTGLEGLFEPTHGIKAALTATPTASLRGGSEFVLLLGTASTYVNLAAPGRSVIAVRGTLGSVQGANTLQIPPDQRLYAGGTATVRGYKYQSVGPRFADNRPTGGTALGAATVEFRQRFGESFGAAVFVDAGTVHSKGTFGAAQATTNDSVRVGAGVGARYYTPIGPIRLDVALPMNKQRGDDTFELYIGIGQAF